MMGTKTQTAAEIAAAKRLRSPSGQTPGRLTHDGYTTPVRACPLLGSLNPARITPHHFHRIRFSVTVA